MSTQAEQPFSQNSVEVRAHHAPNFVRFCMTTPALRPRLIANTLEALTAMYCSMDRGDYEYAYDNLGGKPDEYSGTYSRNSLNIYQEFADLPDDQPVSLTLNKDRICGLCVFGRHCEGQAENQADREALEDFQDTAAKKAKSIPEDYQPVLDGAGSLIGIKTFKRVILDVVSIW